MDYIKFLVLVLHVFLFYGCNKVDNFENVDVIIFEKEFNQIKYFFSTKDQKYSFNTDLEINDTPIRIDFINYKKNKNEISSWIKRI